MANQAARGILYLCLGVLVFSTQDAIIKYVSGAYPLTEVMFFRSLVGLPILAVLVVRETGWRMGAGGASGTGMVQHLPFLTVRALIMVGAYTAYYMAFPALPLADAVALYFTVPLFVTALAGPMLGEHPDWRVWLAVVLGFAGVLIMLQPGRGLFEPAALLSLLSAALYGIAMLMARKKGDALSTSVLAFFQNGAFLVGAGLAGALFYLLGPLDVQHPSITFLVRPWVWPSLQDGLLISACGVVAAVGTLLLTAAYRVAPSSTVTPFEYTGILWAPLWGFLLFAETPRLTTVAGALVIGVAGLMAMHLARRD